MCGVDLHGTVAEVGMLLEDDTHVGGNVGR